MRLFILGSSRHLPEDQKSAFSQCCEALGGQFARAGHTLIVCSASPHTADPHFVRGAAAASKECIVLAFLPSGTDEVSYRGIAPDIRMEIIPTDGGWRVSQLRAIRKADLVIALGGSSVGTTPIIYSAELMERPVVVIPSFGGAARDSWDYFRGRYYKDQEQIPLQSTASAPLNAWASGIVEATDSIRKRFKSQGLSNVVSFSIIGILSVGVWLWTFFATANQLPSELILCVGLASASIVGSMLRLLLRGMGVVIAEWSEKSLFVSIALGLLMGFGMFLFAEFASLSITGGAIMIKGPSDLQRILGTLSPLIFASALFIETAWRRLGQKSEAYFNKH